MKLFGYSISINVLILIGVLYLIMTVNAVSGSCNREGMNFKDRDRFRERKETYEDKMGGLLAMEREIMQAKSKGRLTDERKQFYQKMLEDKRKAVGGCRLRDKIDQVISTLNNTYDNASTPSLPI